MNRLMQKEKEKELVKSGIKKTKTYEREIEIHISFQEKVHTIHAISTVLGLM